jgi:hypothetical protein
MCILTLSILHEKRMRRSLLCNRCVRFNALDIRSYTGPRVDLGVLQGVTAIGGN